MNVKKADVKKFRETLTQGKGYDDLTDFVGTWSGEEEMREIVKAIESRRPKNCQEPASYTPIRDEDDVPLSTPPGRENPEPPSLGAPLHPSNERMSIPAMISRHDALTPTPGGGVSMAVM